MAQRQHKKSQKRFDTLFSAGMLFHEVGNYQSAAEKLLQAVHAAPSVWTKHRYFAFATFLASITITDRTMTQNDADLLTEDFIENNTEPSHFQVRALLSVAFWYTRTGSHLNMSTAAEFLRQGLDIITSSPKEHDKRRVLYHPHPHNVTMKDVLSSLADTIRERLSYVTSVPNQTHNAKCAQLQERDCGGGLVCDCCGKTLEELQITMFKRCSRTSFNLSNPKK